MRKKHRRPITQSSFTLHLYFLTIYYRMGFSILSLYPLSDSLNLLPFLFKVLLSIRYLKSSLNIGNFTLFSSESFRQKR